MRSNCFDISHQNLFIKMFMPNAINTKFKFSLKQPHCDWSHRVCVCECVIHTVYSLTTAYWTTSSVSCVLYFIYRYILLNLHTSNARKITCKCKRSALCDEMVRFFIFYAMPYHFTKLFLIELNLKFAFTIIFTAPAFSSSFKRCAISKSGSNNKQLPE